MAGWVVGAADEVVQGHVIEVSKGNKYRNGRFVLAVFVILVHRRNNTGGFGRLFLRAAAILAATFKSNEIFHSLILDIDNLIIWV